MALRLLFTSGMNLSRPLINRILIAIGATTALIGAGLWMAVSQGYLDSAPQVSVAQIAPQSDAPLSIENLESDLSASISSRATSTLQSPPVAFLDGLEVNPFLLGVVGKENQRVETIPENPVFDRDLVLNDGDSRVDKQFAVSETLRERVGFWFDVYTKYDQNRRIIHHQKFPWIIFKVVDVSDIINADTPRVRWLRNVKADTFVKAEQAKVRTALTRIAKGVPLEKLNEEEKSVADALAPLKTKNLKTTAREALADLRVQTGQRNFFVEGLAVSPRYLSSMEKIFRAKKLPIELTRLPFVESSFNKQAVSKVGASGIWQFMGNTGRKFLIVNGKIDERRSPFKASEAAAMLLRENHMILGRSWPLAITAWNHGPAGVRKACKAAHSKDLGTVVAKYHSKSFDFASSNFYSEFLGALYAERYHDLIFGDMEYEAELQPQIVRVQKSVRIGDVIRSSGLSMDEFLMMNPDLSDVVKSNSYLPVGFRLHLPDQARLGVERLLNSSVNNIALAY